MAAQSGIYEIVNTVNGKRYIGSAKNFANRWSGHLRRLRRNDHHSAKLQRAWNKYGESQFKFLPILTCAPTKEMLYFYEQQLLDKVKPEYNIAVSAYAPMAGRTMSEETRKKMSISGKGKPHRKWSEEERRNASAARKGSPGHPQTDAAKRKVSEARKGKKLSDAHKCKLSIAKAGKKRAPHSAETIEKMRVAATGRKHSAETRKKIGDVQRGKSRPRVQP